MKRIDLLEIIANGGATLDASGAAVTFGRGYQVSKKDCFILTIGETGKILRAVRSVLASLKAGEFCGPIARRGDSILGRCVSPQGKPACTRYCVLAAGPGRFLAACALGTGRTHQIRVHMASIGHPIIGDPVYGLKKDRFSDIGGQCLHASHLTLTHPRTGEKMDFFAPLPAYFTDILDKLERMQ